MKRCPEVGPKTFAAASCHVCRKDRTPARSEHPDKTHPSGCVHQSQKYQLSHGPRSFPPPPGRQSSKHISTVTIDRLQQVHHFHQLLIIPEASTSVRRLPCQRTSFAVEPQSERQLPPAQRPSSHTLLLSKLVPNALPS